MKKNVGILLFEEVEVLDFAGPFEVFSVASELHNHELFNVFTVAQSPQSILTVNGLSVNPTYGIQAVPYIDILVIPGGKGSRKVMYENEVMKWVDRIKTTTDIIFSVCSGSRILGKLGLLKNQPYCTHHEVYEEMQEIAPLGKPQPDKRFTGDGHLYTSAGISAGIDLSLHIVAKLHGKAAADKTAKYMEYKSSE